MKINDVTLADLSLVLSAERKRQKLSREDTAAVCGVSTSFIRDAEAHPENCSLGKLVKLINGLGMRLEVSGHDDSPLCLSKSGQEHPPAAVADNSPIHGLSAAPGALHKVDFGVPEAQLVVRHFESKSRGEPS